LPCVENNICIKYINSGETLFAGQDLTSTVRISKIATRLRKPRMFREYKDATVQHRLLANYLKVATKVLPQTECSLLSEFVHISKGKCQRLKKALERPSGKQRSAA
jgi:hypothetical protein